MPRAILSTEEKVLQFFTTSPLPVAQVILRLAAAMVRNRAGEEKPAAKPKSKPRTAPQAAAGTITEPLAPAAPPPVPQETPAGPAKPKSRRRMSASSRPPVRQDVAEAAGSVEEAEAADVPTGEEEIPLPGIQAEVGDDDLNQATPE